MSTIFAHMCQDEHAPIGHNDSESVEEMACPVCRTRRAIDAVLAAADAKDQPTTSKNIPAALIERLREVSR